VKINPGTAAGRCKNILDNIENRVSGSITVFFFIFEKWECGNPHTKFTT
jgi:hypothetical protein